MQNVTGKWGKALVHEDVAKGYGCCKCLLVCVHNANRGKPQASRFIDTWDRLLDIHHEDNCYRLLPLHCSSTAAFVAMASIAASPGSPFSIDDRVDFQPFRMSVAYKSPVRTAIERFFNMPGADRLPIDRVEFDGVLRNKDSSALVQLRHTINQAQIVQLSNVMKFVTSTFFMECAFVDPIPWREVFSPPNRHVFLVGESPLPLLQEKPLAEFARSHGIQLYHRKGSDYVFLPPPATSVTASPVAGMVPLAV